jgi:hypothetical protein
MAVEGGIRHIEAAAANKQAERAVHADVRRKQGLRLRLPGMFRS